MTVRFPFTGRRSETTFVQRQRKAQERSSENELNDSIL